jgi:ribonuclease BN (tRNA processing enzyme)
MADIERTCSSILLTAGDQSILLDAREGLSKRILELETPLDQISSVFITHTHPDHFAGLLLFIQLLHLKKRRKSLTIFLPSEAEKSFEQFLNMSLLWKEKLGFKIHINAIDVSQTIHRNPFSVTPYPTSHLLGYAKFSEAHGFEELEAFAFVVNVNKKNILYSGDIGSLQDLVAPLQDNAIDLLVIEGMHYDVSKLSDFVRRFSVGRTFITHLDQDPNTFELPESTELALDKLTIEV